MTLRPSLIIGVIAAVALLGVSYGARRVAGAQQRLGATRSALEQASADARRVVELRAAREVIAENRRPDQDVIRRVNEALAAADIPTGLFAGLRPASDTALPGQDQAGPQYRRQSVQVSLGPVDVRQIGAFFAAWSEAGKLWTPSRLDLSHVRDRGAPGRYNLTVMMTTTYVADP